MSKNPDEYSKEETQRRFDAALRGARTAGHKPMSEMRQGKPKPEKGESPRKSTGKKPRK